MADMQPAYHAVLGPSSAHRWRKCTASVKRSLGQPNEGSDASRIGTACHGVVAECLTKNVNASAFIGRTFLFCKHLDGKRYEDFRENINTDWTGLVIEHELEITDEHAEWCDAYVGFVLEQHRLKGGELLVEQRVPIGHITGEEGGAGTSDAILINGTTITVIDAKFGRNRVNAYDMVRAPTADPITGDMLDAVYAPNDQLALYAGGALEAHSLFHDFENVHLVIVQPPLDHVSEFHMPVAALEAHLAEVRIDAERTRTRPEFVVGDHCGYCPARLVCEARDREVLTTALEGFADISDAAQIAAAAPRQFDGNMVGTLFAKVAMIRDWCDDIATRAFNTLNTGGDVIAPDGTKYKLVAGPQGRRQWANVEEAEATLKKMRLKHDEMYSYKLISPTTADKLAHPKAKRGEPAPEVAIGKNQWIKLERLITRSDPKPLIAPATDPRPAFAPAVNGFSSQPTPADNADLF